MKKPFHMFIGILIGAAITVSATAAAEELQSLVGKKIDGEFTVTLNGKELAVKAGTIEGTSYLPVRAVSESLGLDVGFDSEKGISLAKKEVKPMPGKNEAPPFVEIPINEIEDYFTFQGMEAIHYKGEPYFSRSDYSTKYGYQEAKISEKPFEVKPPVSNSGMPYFVFYDNDRKEIARAQFPEGKEGYVLFFANGSSYIHTKFFPKELKSE